MGTLCVALRLRGRGAAVVGMCVGVGLGVSGGCAMPEAQKPPVSATTQKVNEDAKDVADFMERVTQYVALHKKIERDHNLPQLGTETTPEEIDKNQRALEKLTAAARVNAKPGDVFTPPMQVFVRKVLGRIFAGAAGKQMISSIMDENPVGLKLQVNQRYPDTVPMSTMPPEVLQILPKLPEELEYRFIGDRLILLDVHTHLIVDYIDKALPI